LPSRGVIRFRVGIRQPKAFRTLRPTASEMPSGSDRLVGQPARAGECDDTFLPWRERPRLWPRAWSQTRSNLVVAHATVPSLTAWPAGSNWCGRQRAPPEALGR